MSQGSHAQEKRPLASDLNAFGLVGVRIGCFPIGRM